MLFAVLPCEEGAPALYLASLAEVCSCSLSSGRARRLADEVLVLLAVLPREEDGPALNLASLAEVCSSSMRSSQPRTVANDAFELAALLTREGELPLPFLLLPVEVRWLSPVVESSGSGSEARSMCLQIRILAFL